MKIGIAAAMTCTLMWTIGLAQDRSREAAELQNFTNDFLAGIASADWSTFRRFWADDAVMYAPGPAEMVRVEGIAALQKMWQAQFDLMRGAAAKRGVTEAPFVNVIANDLRVDLPAPQVGVVTFHLADDGRIRRRMFVAVKRGAEWRITHLHASDLPPSTGK